MSEEANIQLYTINDTYAPDFDYQRWATYLRDWKRAGPNGVPYSPFGSFTSIAVSNRQLVGIQRDIGSLTKGIHRAVDRALQDGPRFFRLSTRSPKDAWMRLAPDLGIEDTDDNGTKRRKLAAQTRLCMVSSYDDVHRLLGISDRLQEDMAYHIEHAPEDDVMHIILAEWRNVDREVRIFVANGRVLEACPYQVDSWTQDELCALQGQRDALQSFVQGLLRLLPSTYQTAVVDVYFDDTARLHLVELNPFDDVTDPISYTWDYLRTRLASYR